MLNACAYPNANGCLPIIIGRRDDLERMSAENPFSKISSQYSQWRPRYPATLFRHLSARCSSHQPAWDCATGNGQAAVDLAHHFEHVEATDLSLEQISHAMPSDRVRYSVQPAE